MTGTASFASEQLDLTIDPERRIAYYYPTLSAVRARDLSIAECRGEGRAVDRARRGSGGAGDISHAGGGLLALVSPAEGDANQCRAILSQMKKVNEWKSVRRRRAGQ